ncbi:MAG: Rap1a/Tai family immunity protein [Pseudomonadota bacterium]
MIRQLVLLTGIACGMAVLPAQASDKHLFSADILSKFCNSPHGAPYDDGVCAGYITAIADVLLREPDMANRLCVPRNLSTSDFSKLVTRHIARHPDDKTLPASNVIRAALLTAFPC